MVKVETDAGRHRLGRGPSAMPSTKAPKATLDTLIRADLHRPRPRRRSAPLNARSCARSCTSSAGTARCFTASRASNIALWETSPAKLAGLPLYRLPRRAARARNTLDAYASLMRYNRPPLSSPRTAATAAVRARLIAPSSLHEIDVPPGQGGRRAAIGDGHQADDRRQLSVERRPMRSRWHGVFAPLRSALARGAGLPGPTTMPGSPRCVHRGTRPSPLVRNVSRPRRVQEALRRARPSEFRPALGDQDRRRSAR